MKTTAGLQGKSTGGPKRKGRPRGRPWTKGQSGNPSGKRKGCVSLAATLKRLVSRADAEAIAKKLLSLAKTGDLLAMRLLFDRLDGPQNGPLAITMAQAVNVSQENPAVRECFASLSVERLQRPIERLAPPDSPPLPLFFTGETQQPPAPPPLPEPRQAKPEPVAEPELEPPPRNVLTASEFLK